MAKTLLTEDLFSKNKCREKRFHLSSQNSSKQKKCTGQFVGRAKERTLKNCPLGILLLEALAKLGVIIKLLIYLQ